MKKEHLNLAESLLSLLEFKTIADECGNEFVVYKSSNITEIKDIEDKTAFEALENHVHIFDNITKCQKESAVYFSKKLGKILLDNLSYKFPQKHFVVFVTVNTSVIIRFHQKWNDEPWYYMIDESYEGTELLWFDN